MEREHLLVRTDSSCQLFIASWKGNDCKVKNCCAYTLTHEFKCPLRQFLTFNFIKLNVEKVLSSSTLPSKAVMVNSATFMYSERQLNISALWPIRDENLVKETWLQPNFISGSVVVPKSTLMHILYCAFMVFRCEGNKSLALGYSEYHGNTILETFMSSISENVVSSLSRSSSAKSLHCPFDSANGTFHVWLRHQKLFHVDGTNRVRRIHMGTNSEWQLHISSVWVNNPLMCYSVEIIVDKNHKIYQNGCRYQAVASSLYIMYSSAWQIQTIAI